MFLRNSLSPRRERVRGRNLRYKLSDKISCKVQGARCKIK
jgi:hypothetical protein